jgi:hypothetical protein
MGNKMENIAQEEKIEIVKNEVRNFSASLNRDGYSIFKEEIENDEGETFYSADFKSDKAKREVSITFSPDDENYDFFAVSLSNSANGNISLAQYLSLIGFTDELHDPFDLDNYQGEFEKKVADFFAFLRKAFQEDFITEVLKGRQWLDLPVDWGGYK